MDNNRPEAEGKSGSDEVNLLLALLFLSSATPDPTAANSGSSALNKHGIVIASRLFSRGRTSSGLRSRRFLPRLRRVGSLFQLLHKVLLDTGFFAIPPLALLLNTRLLLLDL